jgi:hypothetical protein
MQVIEVPCSSNPICDHSDIIEENIRLKAELAKGLATCIQGEKNLNDLLNNQRMIKGKEGLRFVAESSKKRDLGLVAEPSKKNKKNNNKKKPAAAPTPHVPFDICYTEEEWEELKGKEKEVEETGVSGQRDQSLRLGHLAQSLRPPRPESSVLHIIILQGNIILTMCFSEIIMVMSMLNMLVPMMVTLNMLFGYLRFL